jgi:hypothetical protein
MAGGEVVGQVKQNTHFIPTQGEQYRLSGAHPDSEMHPDWIGAIESLDAYNHWVCEVVLPIAFQWIEEHKNDVYKGISEQERDDVGIVIAEAFEIVKSLNAYKAGIEESKKFQDSVKQGAFNASAVNPVWSAIARAIRISRKAAFAQAKGLKSTVR